MKGISLNNLQKLFSRGSISIPEILLKIYPKMDIDEKKLVIILQLIRFREKEQELFPSLDKLAEVMFIDRETIKVNMAQLLEAGLITIKSDERGNSEYNLEGFYRRLAEEWERSLYENMIENYTMSNAIKKMYPIFEKEFGRPLSPMETSQLVEWCEGDGFDTELIMEALKRSVLRGIRNFRYIDSILKQWADEGVTSAHEASLKDKKVKERIKEAKANSSKPKKKSKERSKYKDLYMNWGG